MAYSHSNDQVEVVNRDLVQGLNAKLDYTRERWVEKLPNILWSYCTTPHEDTSMTPFHLVYGVVVPTKIRMSSARVNSYNEDNAEKRLLELDLVEESREKIAARLKAYK